MEQEERDSSLSGSEPSAVTEEEQSWISWFCRYRKCSPLRVVSPPCVT